MSIDPIKSLMLFHERVLEIGNVQNSLSYDMSELKKALHFNRIYQSNTDEIFQRNNHEDILNQYMTDVKQSISNLDNLLVHLKDHGIVIEQGNSFEKRLITRTRIKDQIVSTYMGLDELKNIQFTDKQVYYLSLFSEGVVLSSIDPRKGIYEKPLSYNFNRFTKYWKADDCVNNYLTEVYGPTITIRVINSETSKLPIKIEYNQKNPMISELLTMAFPEAFRIENKYLYTSDLAIILELNYPSERSVPPTALELYEGPSLASIFHEDMLIEYPEISFDDYLQMLHSASTDPKVASISLCLYRIGDNPTLFYILRNAVEHGIEVNLNMELCARGEDINSFWFNEMRRVGINVQSYASGRKKIHAKITMIQFRDGRRLAQIGTGNYHSETTTVYTDLSYWTADSSICDSLEMLFQTLRQENETDIEFEDSFLVTGYNAKSRLLELISEQQYLGENGLIVAKFNILDDTDISEALSRAAESGCHIHLIIRGICTWFPKQLNKNVVIRSVVWDKLEHSRLYCFGRSNPIIYLGSLDLSKHKLEDRIETLVRVRSHKVIAVWEYLNRYVTDTSNSWVMINDNGNVKYIKEGGRQKHVIQS